MVQDEDSCTRRGWTFYRSGQFVVSALKTADIGTEVMTEAEAEIGKGEMIAGMSLVLAVTVWSFETVAGRGIAEFVAGRKIVEVHWMEKKPIDCQIQMNVAAAALVHFEGKVEYRMDWSNFLEIVKEPTVVAAEMPRTMTADGRKGWWQVRRMAHSVASVQMNHICQCFAFA